MNYTKEDVQKDICTHYKWMNISSMRWALGLSILQEPQCTPGSVLLWVWALGKVPYTAHEVITTKWDLQAPWHSIKLPSQTSLNWDRSGELLLPISHAAVHSQAVFKNFGLPVLPVLILSPMITYCSEPWSPLLHRSQRINEKLWRNLHYSESCVPWGSEPSSSKSDFCSSQFRNCQ